MTLPKAVLIGAAMLAIAIIIDALHNRYQIASGGGPGLSAWKIDRFSGEVWLCAGGDCRRISN
jgi:hypothetical protein